MLPRKILKSTLSDMLFSASFHEIFLQNSVSLKCKNIAHNAYWSQEIYFQFKKVCRSVISRVIIHRRLERAWLIGCRECTAMLIIMMKAANQTMKGARYCFAFCFSKIEHMRIFRVEHFMKRFSILIRCCMSILEWFRRGKSYNTERKACRIITARARWLCRK